MILNREEVLLILNLISQKYGPGYCSDPTVGRLQAKLSIMLEVLSKKASED